MHQYPRLHRFSPVTMALLALVSAMPAQAITGATHAYRLPAQDLAATLRAIGRIAGTGVMFAPDTVSGLSAAPVAGRLTVTQAVDEAIAGSGLVATDEGDTILIRGRGGAPDGAQPPQEQAIVVTGTHIQGAVIASPVITLDRAAIVDAGQRSLPEALASLPQNFGGGQNPWLGSNVPAGSGGDSSGGSSIDLRGLGSDATLTLLDGNRIAYNAQSQSIDISTIPLDALDRIEIVPDGASALYGSDAVAGVANIILRKDYDGLKAGATFGAATDGGDVEQQYTLTGGRRWSSGGFILAYEHDSNTPVTARERDWTAERAPGLDLWPRLRKNNVVLGAHQDVTDTLHFTIDGLFNDRRWDTREADDSRGDYLLNGGERSSHDRAFAVAPALSLDLPDGWHARLQGSYGEDHDRFLSNEFLDGLSIYANHICYCNSAASAELNANGPLFRLPAGAVRIAAGGGFRSSRFQEPNVDVDASQITHYGFAELSLPLIAPDFGIPLLRSLTVDAAGRYEHNSGIGSVTTPKLGIVWSLLDGLDVRGSWGRSFKVPTLFQRFYTTNIGIEPAAVLGGSGYPAGSTAVLLLLGNPDLRPERATSCTTGLDIHPRFLPGTRIGVTWFDTHYRDRIVSPITYPTAALSDPGYDDFVQQDPSQQDVAAALGKGTVFNLTGAPFDPASVVAIVDDRYLNAARQLIHGIDVSASWRGDLGDAGTLSAMANASWLHSTEQLSSLQPVLPLAGTLFNPPHIRARGGLTWLRGGVTLSAFANYTGGVTDPRSAPAVHVGSMTTVDLAARLHTGENAGPFRNLDISLAVRNAGNARPSIIATTSVEQSPYDSTNYSPIGRFVSIGVSRAW